MKEKHTPGPWQVAVDELEDCTYIAGQRVEPQPKPGGNYCPVVAKILHNRTPGERQANARLIAAAPELLDALKEMLDRISIAVDNFELPEGAQSVLMGEEFDDAERAIAKAGGMKWSS